MKDVHSLWHNVSPSTISKLMDEEEPNTGFTFLISPLDIPAAWRSSDEDLGNEDCATIEFKYLSSPEHFKSVKLFSSVLLDIGKDSKRIHKIHFTKCRHESRSEKFDEFPYVTLETFKNALQELKAKEHLRKGNIDSIFILLDDEEPLKTIICQNEEHE